MKRLNKKGQTGGLVTGLIFGITALIIAVIIALTITSTVRDSDLLTSDRGTVTVTGEAGYINTTSYTLTKADSTKADAYSIVAAWNSTSGQTITSGNYTLSSAGVITNASATTWEAVKFNYTYQPLTDKELATNKLSYNLTEGVDNVSGKIPTVLLVAAIVLILGILAVLVVMWQRMRMGGTTTI